MNICMVDVSEQYHSSKASNCLAGGLGYALNNYATKMKKEKENQSL